jgi:hypothetical protein
MNALRHLPGTFARHYKGGHYYVLDISTHTETGEELINYISLYDAPNIKWSRPLIMWHEDVIYQGSLQPRFVEIEPTYED